MANMSYCRFQNTLRDFLECKEAIDEAGGLRALLQDLSRDEKRAMIDLVSEAKELTEDWSDELEDIDPIELR